MENETMIATDDQAGLIRQGDALAEEIKALRVFDDASFQRVGALRRDLAGWLKTGRAFFKRLKDPAYQSWKNIVAEETAVIGPKETLYEVSGKSLADYEQEQERKRQAAEAAARREQERLEAEARAEAYAEQVRLKKEVDDARMAEAVAAAETGDLEAAERLLEAPIDVPTVVPRAVFVPPVQITAPQAKGISFTSTWDFEIETEALIPRQYLIPDLKQIGAVVRAGQGRTKIPGVKVIERRTTRTRSA